MIIVPAMGAWKLKAPVGTVLGFRWSLLMILLFLGLSVLVFVTPRFPLAMGIVRTPGRSGLWITLLPVLTGLQLSLLRPIRHSGA